MIAEADGGRRMVAVAVLALALGLPLARRGLARLGGCGLGRSRLTRPRLRPRPRGASLPIGAAFARLPGLAGRGWLGLRGTGLLAIGVPILPPVASMRSVATGRATAASLAVSETLRRPV